LKPSVFSKDYNRYVKRKKRIKFILLLIAAAVIFALLIFRFGIKTYFDNIIKAPAGPSASENSAQKETPPKQTVTENKFKDIKLSDSLTIKLGLDINGTAVKYSGLLSEGINGSYDISSAGNQMVFLDKNTQTVYLIDKDGKSTDITYKKYVSKTRKVYEKSKILKTYADYIWVDSPKFLGENKILYISNIPWFGANRSQYLWIYDIKSESYKYNLKGKKITLNGLKTKGYEVSVDGKLYYIDNNGGLVK
jgi:hypothetical protein